VAELIGSNPVERAKRPRVQAQEPGTVWTIAQLRTFLATAQQHRLFAFFHVAAFTGARRGELVNLQWKDIDLDGKKITITGSTAVIASPFHDRKGALSWEPPLGIEPMTYALRGACSLASGA